MDMFFIPARARIVVQVPLQHIKKLPANVCLATASQFTSQLKNIKTQLEKEKKSSKATILHLEIEKIGKDMQEKKEKLAGNNEEKKALNEILEKKGIGTVGQNP